MRLTSKELCERIKTDIAIKTSTREQGQQIVQWIREGGGLGFHWYIIWEDAKRGTIYSVVDGKFVYDRDAEKFKDKEIVLFKNLKVEV